MLAADGAASAGLFRESFGTRCAPMAESPVSQAGPELLAAGAGAPLSSGVPFVPALAVAKVDALLAELDREASPAALSPAVFTP